MNSIFLTYSRKEYMTFSGYRFLWLQVLFDLPVKKKRDRKSATDFRNYLLDLGFSMAQFSVYQRFCASKAKADVHISKIERNLPDKGKVHILMFTDKQYENMRTFHGKKLEKGETNTGQLLLF